MFRIGGDELLALCSCISKDEFEAREKRFKEAIDREKIPLAVGFSWKKSIRVFFRN